MDNNQEPSVLDYIKSLLIPGRERIEIPALEEDINSSKDTIEQTPEDSFILPGEKVEPDVRDPLISLPWITLLALLAALIAQFSLEPRLDRNWLPGTIFYAASAAALVFAMVKRQFVLAESSDPNLQNTNLKVDWIFVGISVGLAAAAFLFFGNGRFTTLNTFVWLASIGFFIFGVKTEKIDIGKSLSDWCLKIRSGITIKLSLFTVLWIAVLALSIFFRVTQINEVPSQMVSDHAEKLYDVSDVINGQHSIFFTRNTGREAFQFYWTALIVKVFNTGISFLSLKIGTILLGLATLPFIYLLGKEMGNRRVGLFAMLFAGIAYWPNLISRVALRFTLYPFFFAPTLYFFLRGMRTQKRRYFVLSGLFLGIGLHGYTPFRVVPVLLVLAAALFILHNRSNRAVRHAMVGLTLVAFIAILVTLPLLRYTVDHPDEVMYRMMTRAGSIEQPLPGPGVTIFLQNFWRAMTMFAWDNGEVWVLGIPHRPILDIVSGALYHLGFVAVLIQYIRKRRWTDLLVLISIPLLMLPSIFSLAFPAENPSLNRTAGAIIPVFLLIGFALDGIYGSIQAALGKTGRLLASGLITILLFVSASQNYDLVFNQYRVNFDNASWNSSQIGGVVKDFIDTWGSRDSAYVVGYPHWVDTRLVGINAGTPDKDYAIFPEQIPETAVQSNPKLFVVNVNDTTALEALISQYPEGVMRLVPSEIPGREFFVYFVPH